MSILNSPTDERPRYAAAGEGRSYPARGRKIAPSHPGAVLADLLDEQRISLRTAAAAIGLSPNALSKVMNAKSPVTPDTALRLGTWLGNGPELWLNLQRDYDIWEGRQRLAAELGKIKPLERA